MLVYLLNHNILPGSNSKNVMRVSNYYFLDKMEFGLGDIESIPLDTISSISIILLGFENQFFKNSGLIVVFVLLFSILLL